MRAPVPTGYSNAKVAEAVTDCENGIPIFTNPPPILKLHLCRLSNASRLVFLDSRIYSERQYF